MESNLVFAKTCPSVDEVVKNASNGIVKINTEYDFSSAAAIASAMLCNIEASGIKMCAARVGLINELLAAGQDAFDVGETTNDVLVKLQNKLSQVNEECGL